MPIDKYFKTTWIKVGEHESHPVRKSSKDPSKEIHGEIVGVDFSLCFGCEKCITICPAQVFVPMLFKGNRHVVDPVNDANCIRCLACELVCPIEAICVEREGGSEDTLKSLLEGSY